MTSRGFSAADEFLRVDTSSISSGSSTVVYVRNNKLAAVWSLHVWTMALAEANGTNGDETSGCLLWDLESET